MRLPSPHHAARGTAEEHPKPETALRLVPNAMPAGPQGGGGRVRSHATHSSPYIRPLLTFSAQTPILITFTRTAPSMSGRTTKLHNMKKVVSLSLDEGLLAKIDQSRGDVSRSRFVENQLVGRVEYAPDYDSKPSSGLGTPSEVPVGTGASDNSFVWRCKHRSCAHTSPKAGQCPIHLGSLVRSDWPDQLIA